jgi:sodium/pantothenate symporter
MEWFEPIPIIFISTFLVYLLLLAFLTVISLKKTDSVKDFVIAGGTTGAFLTGIAYFATQFSMSSLMGLPGVIYNSGFAAIAIILPITMFSMGFGVLVVGRRLQRLSKKLDLYTLPDYLGSRYESKFIRFISASMILFFMIPYMGAQIVGAGIVFNVFTGAPYWIGVVIMGGIVLIYSMLGGMNAAVFTDALQGVLMVLASVGVFIAVIIYGGGLTNILDDLKNANPGALSFPGAPVEYLTWKGYISQILIWTLFSIGQPQLINKYLVARNYRTLLTGSIYSGAAMTIVCVTIWIAGVLAIVVVPGITDSDAVIPILLGTVMSPIIASIIAAGILSAGMSTIDSMLIVTSTAFSRDIYQKIYKPDMKDETVLKITRTTTVVVGIAVIILALIQPASIFQLILFSWTGMGILALPIIVGLYWKRATKQGAIVGVISGLFVLISTTVYFKSLAFGFNPIVMSALVALVLLIAVSLVTSPPSSYVLEGHFTRRNSQKGVSEFNNRFSG